MADAIMEFALKTMILVGVVVVILLLCIELRRR